MKRPRRCRAVVTLGLALTALLTACADPDIAAPTCEPDQRLGILAQAVPGAAYVPCIGELAPGWHVASFEVDDDGSEMSLRSDRAERPVDIRFDEECDVRHATPVAPRGEGVRTYLRVLSVEDDYSGRMMDVFPGGCVTYEFTFERGPHIALTDELASAVELYPRSALRRALREDFGITLDP